MEGVDICKIFYFVRSFEVIITIIIRVIYVTQIDTDGVFTALTASLA